MQKLYLHTGVHRTATSSTQLFLRSNFLPLLQKGWLYPYGAVRHDQKVRAMVNKTLSVEEFARDLQQRANSHDHAVHSVVLSDEDLSIVPDFSLFAPLADRFDVKVVVSLRRQDLWLESWYLQNVKWQWNPLLAHLTFDQFFKRRKEFFWVDYAARLAHYEQVFGAGSVVAGVFERADMPEGPIAAFLNMVGLSDMTGLGPFLHANSSMSPQISEFMRQLPLDQIDERDRSVVERIFVEMDKTLPTNGSKLIMRHDQRQTVMAECAASNRLTAQRYLGREVLFAEPLPGPDALLADIALPANSADLMQIFVRPFVTELGEKLTSLRLERDRPAGPARPGPHTRSPKAQGRKASAAAPSVVEPPRTEH
jgi:hypothetical protein